MSAISKLKNFVLPLSFVGALLFSLMLGDHLPEIFKSFMYSISIVIKECLIFALPVVVFSLIFLSIARLGAGALKFIAILVPLVCFSNYFSTIASFCVGNLFIGSGAYIASMSSDAAVLSPYFEFSLPRLVSNDIALLSGVVLGFIGGLLYRERTIKFGEFMYGLVMKFFKVLMPMMPLFILGTTLKLQHEDVLTTICKGYSSMLLVFVIVMFGYIMLFYLLLSGFKFKKFLSYIGNVFPAAITGFGAMSSAAAMPMAITAAEKNLENKDNAYVIIPATVNIHLIGDCMFIPLMALSLMNSFGMELPTMGVCLLASLKIMIARFAVAAVPGGGILVCLPILYSCLGFTPEMLSVITAVYVLFDPINTAGNVFGNGAFAIFVDKIMNKFNKKTA